MEIKNVKKYLPMNNKEKNIHCPYCNRIMEYKEIKYGGEKFGLFHCKSCNKYYILELNFWANAIFRLLFGIFIILPIVLLEILLNFSVILSIFIIFIISIFIVKKVEKEVEKGKFQKWSILRELKEKEIRRFKIKKDKF